MAVDTLLPHIGMKQYVLTSENICMAYTLPKPTTDTEVAKSDLAEHGYCFLADALNSQGIEELSNDLRNVCAYEREQGIAQLDGGKGLLAHDGVNQRVWGLFHKGAKFRDLLKHEAVMGIVRSVIGESILLSAHAANIAKEGGAEMKLHTDQWWMPQPVTDSTPSIMAGDFNRKHVPDAPASTPRSIAPTAVVNVIWMLVDFTRENGATRVVPGSHRLGEYPREGSWKESEVQQACAPAGTALLIDGRIWHGTGANIGGEERLAVLTTFCAPQFRQQENFTLSTDRNLIKELDADILELLGFRAWNGYGRSSHPTDEWVMPD